MPETDKILEAEQTIQSMASELKRMRDAANILQDTQKKTAMILDATDRVIEVTQEFASAAGDIVRKLSATDLSQRFDTIQGGIKEISALVTKQAKETADATASVESGITQLTSAFQTNVKGSKKRHTMTIVLIILTLVAALASAILGLFPGIGG